MSVLTVSGPAQAFPGESGHEEVIPWLDQPPPSPFPQLVWERLDSRITPRDQFFVVSHYGTPALDAQTWRLELTGLVARPDVLSLADLRARTRSEVEFTMECSGNHGLPFLTGLVGNARWAGTPLAAVLERAGRHEEASEVVFWGADAGTVTIRDNGGIRSAGRTGTGAPDGPALDLTITERFARSMSVEDALQPDNLLCFEMNGAPLPPEHGFPGADGGRRDRVDVHLGHPRPSQVGTRPGRAPRRPVPHHGRRLGRADRRRRGPHRRRAVDGGAARPPGHANPARQGLRVDVLDPPVGRPATGEHTVTSRAYDVDGNVQPAPDDPFLAEKVTFWESNGHITRRVRITPPG